MGDFTRRHAMMNGALALGSGIAVAATPGMTDEETGEKKKIVAVAAHPDDAESFCGGTLALCADAGHDVTIVCLTRGELGIPGKTPEEAAKIRTEETVRSCGILGVKPVFAGQLDGHAEFSDKTRDAFKSLIEKEAPDVLLTHWPIDNHPDHRVASILSHDVLRRSGDSFEMYYFEGSGYHTHIFHPTDYVDISSVIGKKMNAVYCHKSQNREVVYPKYHRPKELFRGQAVGCEFAEAFVKYIRSADSRLQKTSHLR